MVIERNGQQIELTSDEMHKIYREIDRQYMAEDLVARSKDKGKEITMEQALELAETLDNAVGNNDSYFESYWLSVEEVLRDAGYID